MVKYKLWDAHAHIQEPWFSMDEINLLINRAIESSIEGIINVISSPKGEDYKRGLELASKYHVVHLNFGLQPTVANEKNFIEFRKAVEENLNSIKAIGEVGLDYHWIKEKKQLQLQRDIFKKIINLANDLSLPLVIHSRKAEDECLNILEKYADVPVLMHGVEATLDQINKIVDLDYVLSVPTSVCIRKKYKKIALRTPIEHILLETDSPFQLPFNQIKNEERIKNEPSNIEKSAETIAVLKDIEIEEIARVTRTNTLKFFKIKT